MPPHAYPSLCTASTLAGRIEELGAHCIERAQLPQIIEVVLQACDAVAEGHARGVIHGALTASCVVLGPDGGVSVRERADAPETATVPYYSTEQAWGRHNDLDERTDVHAFGGMLFLLLTLRAPHANRGDVGLELAAARRGAVSAPQTLCPDRELPSVLCGIASRALAASPNDRYPSIALFKQAVERFTSACVADSPISRTSHECVI